MRAYSFDRAGRYAGEVECQPAPGGGYLVPLRAVLEAPPVIPPGYFAEYAGNSWRLKEEQAPAEAPAMSREMEIRARLSAIDGAGVRPSREIAAALSTGAEAPAFAVAKLATLEAEAATLRAELAAL